MTSNPYDEWARAKLQALLLRLTRYAADELQLQGLTLIAAANRCRGDDA